MSAWGIGRAGGMSTLSTTGGMSIYVDRVVKWIPADVIGIYTVGITTLRTQKPDPNPSVFWLSMAAALTIALVLMGAYKTNRALKRKDFARGFIAVISYGIWSLAIPDSGWY